MSAIPQDFSKAMRVLLTKPGGLCVAMGVMSAMGGAEKGTAASLKRHGLRPTGNSKRDIELHLRWHREQAHFAAIASTAESAETGTGRKQ